MGLFIIKYLHLATNLKKLTKLNTIQVYFFRCFMQQDSLTLFGYASGLAAENVGCGAGPVFLQQSDVIGGAATLGWQDILYPLEKRTVLATVTDICQRLALGIKQAVEQKKFFTVIGGEHSSAIGTWSGVVSALGSQQSLGLIWVDAHMDSHTFETTPSGNIHGMPLASLLGYGAKELTSILTAGPKLLPQHVCLIGVRSYESGEAELLKQLGVRIYFIEEIQRRGLAVVMQEAVAIVKKGTAAFGISIDLDAIDPQEAPGVGSPEVNGLEAEALVKALQLVSADAKLIGAEIVEFNPYLDRNNLTLNVIKKLLNALSFRKK